MFDAGREPNPELTSQISGSNMAKHTRLSRVCGVPPGASNARLAWALSVPSDGRTVGGGRSPAPLPTGLSCHSLSTQSAHHVLLSEGRNWILKARKTHLPLPLPLRRNTSWRNPRPSIPHNRCAQPSRRSPVSVLPSRFRFGAE